MRTSPIRILITAAAIALSVCPASNSAAQISVRTSLSDDREVTPGASYQGTIMVRNETAEEQEVKVYQTDYLFHFDGSNDYAAPGSTARSNAGWIRVAPRQFVIPAAETFPVNYVVDVPDTSLTGTYWSMIMVQAVPKDSPESVLSDTEEERYGLVQVLRYGVQVATHLPGDEEADLHIDNTELFEDAEGNASLQLSLENKGVRMVRPSVWMDLYDAAGNSYGRKDGVTNRIYPDTSVMQRFDLGRLDKGTYKALVFVDAGDDAVSGVEYSLEIE